MASSSSRVSRNSQVGVSLLLEVVIGLGIFAAAMLLIFGLFASSKRATTSAKNMGVATDLAREVMETELAKGYGGVTTGPVVQIPMPATVNGVSTTTLFDTKVEVFDEAPGAAPNNFPRRRIVVTVSWQESELQRQAILETYLVQ